jgi:hypothetical protein
VAVGAAAAAIKVFFIALTQALDFLPLPGGAREKI